MLEKSESAEAALQVSQAFLVQPSMPISANRVLTRPTMAHLAASRSTMSHAVAVLLQLSTQFRHHPPHTTKCPTISIPRPTMRSHVPPVPIVPRVPPTSSHPTVSHHAPLCPAALFLHLGGNLLGQRLAARKPLILKPAASNMFRYRDEPSDEEPVADRPARRRRVGGPPDRNEQAGAAERADPEPPGDGGAPAGGADQDGAVHPFRQWLLEKYAEGKLSAVDVCAAAAAVGEHSDPLCVSDLVLPTLNARGRRQGGNASRKIAAACGLAQFGNTRLFQELLPVHDKKSGQRRWVKHPFCLPHMTLKNAVDGGVIQSLVATDVELLQLPKVAEHPVVVNSAPGTVVVARLYLDSAPYGGRARAAQDSVLGIYWTALRGNRKEIRRPITVIRKADCCRCGCGGRCTVDAALRTIAWSFEQLQTGTFANARHDGRRLPASLRALAGQAIGVRAALCELGCDLMEHIHLGFRATNALVGPCIKCTAGQRDLHSYTQELPPRTHADYSAEVQRCRVERLITAAEAGQLQDALMTVDRGDLTERGRVLGRSAAGFLQGDRLEVGGVIRDICVDLRQLSVFPARVVMWRNSPNNWLNWECPLFRQVLSIQDVVCDLLHTTDLGTAAYTGGNIFALLLDSHVLGVDDSGDQAAYLRRASRALEPTLMRWYETHPEACSLGALAPSILLGPGGMDRPSIKAKAMETRFLFYFACELLAEKMPLLRALGGRHAERADYLAKAASKLSTFYATINAHGVRLPAEATRAITRDTQAHAVLLRRSGCDLAPKHHQQVEMCKGTARHGNPRFYSTYPDETFNMVVTRVARMVHPRTFAVSTLLRLHMLHAARGHWC
jgi:hypothetical protein